MVRSTRITVFNNRNTDTEVCEMIFRNKTSQFLKQQQKSK
jgi:hypothetical protein